MINQKLMNAKSLDTFYETNVKVEDMTEEIKRSGKQWQRIQVVVSVWTSKQ